MNLGSEGLSLHSGPAFYGPQDRGQSPPVPVSWAETLHVLVSHSFLVPRTKQLVRGQLNLGLQALDGLG